MLERKPDFIIGEAVDPYLSRWWIFRKYKWLPCVYIHRFHKSDDDRALHDHPWFNASILLYGSYDEHQFRGVFRRLPGFMYFRHPWRAHRVELLKDPEGGDLLPAVTLFITSPKIRNWGFCCPKGWRPWWEYVSVRDGGNAIGRGCDD